LLNKERPWFALQAQRERAGNIGSGEEMQTKTVCRNQAQTRMFLRGGTLDEMVENFSTKKIIQPAEKLEPERSLGLNNSKRATSRKLNYAAKTTRVFMYMVV